MRSLLYPLAAGLATVAASAQSPLDTFAAFGENNGGASPFVIYFDLDVTTANGVTVTSFDVDTPNVGAGLILDVYIANQPALIASQDVNAWTLVATGTGTGAGINARSNFNTTDFALAPGSYGVAVAYTNMDGRYFGSGAAPAPVSFSNADMTLTTGGSSLGIGAPDGLGIDFFPRLFTGAIYYDVTGLNASFVADVTEGPAPLAVQFTDLSTTQDAGGITGWDWDLDGDGNSDSTAQNPSFTYACGTYDVSLTVTDANGNNTATRVGYIVADPVVASFTQDKFIVGTGTAVAFTGVVSPGATFAWDFDNDGNIDDTSNLATSFTYTAGGTYTPTLSATLSCNTFTASSTIEVVQDAIFAPTAAGGAGLASPPDAAYFDVDVVPAEGLLVTELFHAAANSNEVCDVEFWVNPNTGTSVVGNEAASNFVLVATGSATSPAASPARCSRST